MSSSVAPTSPGRPPPALGVQASFVQPRQPAFWLYLVLLGIGSYLFVDEQSLFSQLPTALTLPGAWPALCDPVFLIIYRLDLFEREPS